MNSKFISSLLLVIVLLNCMITITSAKQNHNNRLKKNDQKSFVQNKQQQSNQFHTIPLLRNLPDQEKYIQTINLLKQHQALLLQMDTYSFLEITSDKQIVKQEKKLSSSFLQTDMKKLKNQQSVELRNRDNTYFTGTILVGKQPFDVIFDTGSAFVFINSDYCEPCMVKHNYFTATDTLEELGLDVSVQFGSGKITGILSKDIFQIGEIELNKGVFGQIVQEEGYIFENSSFDGIVGLSRENLAETFPSMLEQLKNSGELEEMKIGFYLERDQEGSQITIGGIDQSKYDGEMNYHKVIDGTNFWTLSCTEIRIGDKNTGLCSEDNVCRLVLDSGTSLFTGPTDSVSHLLKSIDDGHGCQNLYDLPPIVFVIEDHEYSIYPSEYIITVTQFGADPFYQHSDINQVFECMIGFYGLDLNDQGQKNSWILGDVFMGKFYTIFDVENQRIGLARSNKYASYIH